MMKKVYFFCLCFFCLSHINSQTQSHPTIESVSVNYKQPLVQTDDTPGSESKVFPETTIKLVSTDNISKVHLKIINFLDNSLIYDVNYSINSENVLDNSGKMLFSKTGSTFYINGSTALPLKTYFYELRTEDNQGNLSPIFSEIH